MNWVDTTILLSQVVICFGVAWVAVGFYRFINRKFDALLRELIDSERDRAYRQGVVHGWDTHEHWSQNTANHYRELQGRSSQN